MTDNQTTPAPAPAPKTVIKPEELVSQTMAALPGLDQGALLQVFTAYALSQTGRYDAAKALAAMGRSARQITADSLTQSAQAVGQQTVAAISKLWQDFLAETYEGDQSRAPALNIAAFTERLKQEKDQHEGVKVLAADVLAQARKVADALGIKDEELVKTATAVAKKFDVSKAASGAVRTILFTPPPTTKANKTEVLGWLTPLKISKDDPDVVRLQTDFAGVVNDGLTGADAIAQLELLGYDRATIVTELRSLIEKCKAQIAESEAILKFVEEDYNTHFKPAIEKATWLNTILDAVNKFYNLAPPPAAPTPRSGRRY